ncbi:MAG: histidinol-phosphate transaminase [Oscillatoria sp. PMC 1068.18]|nr:histidinol-phosphate transaminase [Oscillatoria sp. PMC 1076.18]MEC4990642.1 histidinol-phosphate transaminase [Oscillatoria sp. PMC 1068.18]
MLDFIRSDLAEFTAYTPHPGGKVTVPIDRLDTNESPYDLPIELKQKLTEIYQENLSTNRYPDGSHERIKQVLAEYVNESASLNLDKVITADRLSLGNGSDELIRSILIATCLRGEGSILVANPTFSMYEIIAKTLGIPVVSVGRSESDFAIDLAAAEASLSQTDNPPIRVVFVVHPNSPTANALTEAELDWLRNLPEQILVVIDEAYFEFSQTSVVGELGKHPNWIILRTFSKAFRLAAHRVGYAIANPELIAILEKVRLPYNLPAFSQAAALLTLEKRQLILPAIAKILSERDKLHQALSQNPGFKVWHSDANFIYLRLKNSSSDSHEELKQLTNTLKAQGTLIRHTGGGLRITVGTPAENARTIERLLGIGDW